MRRDSDLVFLMLVFAGISAGLLHIWGGCR